MIAGKGIGWKSMPSDPIDLAYQEPGSVFARLIAMRIERLTLITETQLTQQFAADFAATMESLRPCS